MISCTPSYTGRGVEEGMDVEAFHKNLLGIDQEATPEPFRLTQLQQEFYEAAMKGSIRGFSATPAQPHIHVERFLATFVLAMILTDGTQKVLMAVPEPHHEWVKEQSAVVLSRIFGQRKNHHIKSILALREATIQINMTARILPMAEPERWVAFGFQDGDTLPEWVQGRLL